MRRLESNVAKRVVRKLEWLAENFETIKPEPLRGPMKGLFKLRVGDWRVIYSVDLERKVIVVHMVGHRREIYRL